MPLLFTCPYCQTETMVDDPFLGQSGPCAICGRIVTVPAGQSTGVARPIVRQKSPGMPPGSLIVMLAVVLGSLLAGVAVIGLTIALVAPAVTVARVSGYKAKSAEQLQQIGKAMAQYHTDYGSFPPAYLADANGKPMHSWRVLLLPYLGHRDLYRQYDFTQPWDSPQNAMLLAQMPEVYASPGDDSALSTYETSYVVIVGPATVFPGSTSRNMNEVTDGLGSTLLVVECYESGIGWMEPKDLEARNMQWSINGPNNDCIRSPHPDGANVVFADGRTRFLSTDLPPEYVEAFSTANKDDIAPLD